MNESSWEMETGDLEWLGRALGQGSFVFVCFLLPVTLVGAVGNGMAIFIYLRRSNRSNCINVLLAGLASFDLTMLVVGTAVNFPVGLDSFLYLSQGSSQYWLYAIIVLAVRFAYPFMMIAQTGSIWCLVVITAERFLAVCYPFRARSLCTRTRSKIALAAITAAAVAYNGSRFAEYRIYRRNGTMDLDDSFRFNPSYHYIYVTWMYFLFMFSIPFLVVISLTARILATIRRANRDRRAISSQQARETRTTEMMIVIVVIFVLSNILPFGLAIVELKVAGHGGTIEESLGLPGRLWYNFLTDLSNLLVEVNSAANFGIYMAFSRNFRRQVLSLLRWPNSGPPLLEDASRLSEARMSHQWRRDVRATSLAPTHEAARATGATAARGSCVSARSACSGRSGSDLGIEIPLVLHHAPPGVKCCLRQQSLAVLL